MSTEPTGWNLYEIALAEDAHARWREIREASPVLDAGEGVFFVTRWDLVDEVLRDPRHGAGSGVSSSFAAEGGDAEEKLAFAAMRVWLMSLDGEEQTRARGLVRREFTPRRIEALRPAIEHVVDDLLERVRSDSEQGPVDLIERLAFALPSEIIRSLFGIPPDEWRNEVESVIRSVDDSPGASIEMIDGLAHYFENRLARGDVPDGLLSQLRIPDRDLGSLSTLEVVANAVLLVTAAIDTTAGLIGNTVHCLLEHPAILDRVRSDAGLVPNAIEETLRFEPPALSCSRRAGETVEIGGVTVPKGSQMLLGLAAANRDPNHYADPDRFDIGRNHQGLLSFGGGRHVCLGATLARLEAQIAIERLIVQAGFEFERIEGPAWQKKNPTVRALERLPVRIMSRMA